MQIQFFHRRFHLLFVVCFIFFIINTSFASELLWNYKLTSDAIDASPAIGDIDGDGVLDIVLVTNTGRIFALDATGHKIWQLDTGEKTSTPPILVDVCEDQGMEVLAMTNSGRILCLDAKTGLVYWQTTFLQEIIWGKTAICASDIQGDGQVEIIAADSY